MWELICHHDYRWGAIAADRSPWRSDGFVSGVASLPGGSGLQFGAQNSRVVIPRKRGDPWGQMHAVRVEIVASAQQNGGTLIHADGSFSVGFDGPREIIVDILGHSLPVRLVDLPIGNPVRFEFSHNGVNEFVYNYSYTLTSGLGEGMGTASPTSVPGVVPPVGPEGVWFGSLVDSQARRLHGSIYSVKIWRRDPQTMIKTFLRRPFTPPLLECWGRFVRRIDEAATKDPECATWLTNMLGQVHSDFFVRLAQQSPEAIAEFWKMCEAYQALWAAGKVGSPEMTALVERLRDWLRAQHLFSGDDPDLQPFCENPCIANLTGAIGGLECDTDVQTLIAAVLGGRNGQAAHG